MATHTETAVNDLQRTALENLWVYLREPSDMAEKGEPQIFVEGRVAGNRTRWATPTSTPCPASG